MSTVAYIIPPQLQQKITADQAFHYRIVPVLENDEGIILKTDSDSLKELLAELQIVLDTPVTLEKCEAEELQRYLSSNYRQIKPTANAQLTFTADFLEKILIDAKQVGSSDIHFEPVSYTHLTLPTILLV